MPNEPVETTLSTEAATVRAREPGVVPRRRGRRWIPAGLVLVAMLSGFVTALLQPGGVVRADVSEDHRISAIGPSLAPGETVTLEVSAQEDRLAALGVMFATYMDSVDCTLSARLVADGVTVATDSTPCEELRDNALAPVLRMAPIADSAGKDYELVLALAPGSVSGPAVWVAPAGSQSVVSYYDPQPRLLDHLGRVLDRIDDYAGPWGAAPGLALLGLLAVASTVAVVVQPRWGLVAIVLLVVVRGLVWTALVPPLLGMDEGAHFANVQYIAEEGALPNQVGTPRGSGAYSESLQVTSDAVHVSAYPPGDRPDFGAEAREALRQADSRAGTQSDGTGPASSYPPGYYAPAALLYLAAPDDTVAQVQAARLWSVLLGAAAVALAWLFAGEAFPGRPLARAGLVTAVALQPMLSHQFAIVNNDALVIAAGFGAIWAAARLTRSAAAPGLMLLAGVLTGLGLLGKPFAAVAVLPVAVGWLIGKVRYRVTDWRVLVGEPAWAALGVAGTFGVWYAVAGLVGIRTGLGFPDSTSTMPTDLVTYLATQYDPGLVEFRGLWVGQYWGNFGWVNTPLSETTYDVLWWCYLAVAAGVVAWLVVILLRRPRTEEQRHADAVITVCLSFFVLAMGGLYLIEWGYFAATGSTNLLQGRYLLMTAPALLALPGLLVQRLSGARRWPTIVTWCVAAGVFAVHCQGILAIVRHYYL